VLDLTLRMFLALVLFAAAAAAAPSNGFGDGISWLTLDEAKTAAAAQNKPIMLIIHKSWCGACKALKPKFSESAIIAELSEYEKSTGRLL
jgi:protein-disulfide reductase (glutathione)